MLLTGCASAQTQIAIRCPQLMTPPPSVVAKLEEMAARGDDKAAERYIVALEKHYRKLGKCK